MGNIGQLETEGKSSEAKSSDSEDTAIEVDAERLDDGLQCEISGSFKLEISEDMTIEEIVGYMAD